MSNPLLSIPCFDCTFSDSFNNPDSFPDVIFETIDGTILAHRFILYQNRYFKNLFEVHEKVLTPLASPRRHVQNNDHLLHIPIQEPYKLFKCLLEYFYSGIVNCEVNDLCELIMMAYRFKIINLITILKKTLIGDAASNILAKSQFEKSEILHLPDQTKMTMENALSLFGDVAGNSVLEGTVFKVEIALAKRVILKSICFSLLFTANTTIEKLLKFSVNSMNELLMLIIQHLDLIKQIQGTLFNVSIINSPLNMKEIIKFTLKWMCYMKQERLFSISELYDSLHSIESALQQQVKEVPDFIKSIQVMKNMASNKKVSHQYSDSSENQDLSDSNRKRGSTLLKLKSMYSSPSNSTTKTTIHLDEPKTHNNTPTATTSTTTSSTSSVLDVKSSKSSKSTPTTTEIIEEEPRRMKRTSTFIQPKINL